MIFRPLFYSIYHNVLSKCLAKERSILRHEVVRVWDITVCRTILSESITRLEQYKRQRIFKVDQLRHQGKAELFEILENISSVQEARKHFFKLVEATQCSESREDCRIVENVSKLLMTSSNSESKEFLFGANVMRMYHYLDMPDEAFAVFKNNDYNYLFKDNTCHLLLMDLLYKCGQYSRAVDVYFGMERFSTFCATLAFGSLYHINSAESLTRSQELLIHMATKYAVSRRAVLFAAMHALNQGDPGCALETLKFCKPDSVRNNIELSSLCKLHRVKDLLSKLKEMLRDTEEIDKLWGRRIYSDAWQEILAVMENQSTKEEREEFYEIKEKLERRGVLSQRTIDNFLERVIPGNPDYKKERAKRIIHRTPHEQPP